MNRQEMTAFVLEEAAKSPRIAKNTVVIGYLYDTKDDNGNPSVLCNKVNYDVTHVRRAEFWKELDILPTRALRFIPGENDHIKWDDLKTQFESDFNKGKIFVIWDGPAEAAKAAKEAAAANIEAAAKEAADLAAKTAKK